jgi:hypothetical protein
MSEENVELALTGFEAGSRVTLEQVAGLRG